MGAEREGGNRDWALGGNSTGLEQRRCCKRVRCVCRSVLGGS